MRAVQTRSGTAALPHDSGSGASSDASTTTVQSRPSRCETAYVPSSAGSGTVVSAQNVVSLTQRDEYTLFNDNLARKEFLVAILKASSHALISGRGSANQLARLMVSASEQQRLQVWSSAAGVQKELAATSYGGVLAANDRPLAAPVLNNMSSGKLDFTGRLRFFILSRGNARAE